MIFDETFQLGMGLLLGIIVALGARRASMLTTRGAVAAAIVGALTFGFGGLAAAVLLLAFFVSSSLLSRHGAKRKLALEMRSSKGSERDQWQVAANGAVPALLSVGYGLTGQELWLVGIAGALAASNADTWATEVGVLGHTLPRMITNLKPAGAGTSGAISPLGSMAALAGALLIGLIASSIVEDPAMITVAGAAGVIASMLDSLMGATVQAQYRCPRDDHITEQHPSHTCGTTTVQVRGLSWLGNDQVNLVASIGGAVLAVWLWGVLG